MLQYSCCFPKQLYPALLHGRSIIVKSCVPHSITPLSHWTLNFPSQSINKIIQPDVWHRLKPCSEDVQPCTFYCRYKPARPIATLVTLSEDRKRSLEALHVVAREGAEVTWPLARADVPAVIALLHHEHGVTLFQLKLVFVLGTVVVEGAVAEE